MSLFKHAFLAMDEADVVLEVVDARFADMMQNVDLERKLLRNGKIVILVFNKLDLVDNKADYENARAKNLYTIAISCAPKKNINHLRALIFSKLPQGGKIAVVGFPNVGKSSVINALTGRHSAPTSKQAGFTRGKSLIKIKEDVYVFDTPGVIPYDQRNEFQLLLMNAKSPNQVQDIENPAVELLTWLRKSVLWGKWLQKQYGFELGTLNAEDALEQLAVKMNRLRKGGLPDTRTMAIQLWHDWQKGKSKSKTQR